MTNGGGRPDHLPHGYRGDMWHGRSNKSRRPAAYSICPLHGLEPQDTRRVFRGIQSVDTTAPNDILFESSTLGE